jgi:hypothetical protein
VQNAPLTDIRGVDKLFECREWSSSRLSENGLLAEITAGLSSAKAFSSLRQEILGKRDQKKLPNRIERALFITPSGMTV